jgi:hypothetical protein
VEGAVKMRANWMARISVLLAIALSGCGTGGDETQGGPPSAETLAVEQIAATSALVRGKAVPNGLAAEAWFEWDTDPGFPSPAQTPPLALGAGYAPISFSQDISGLTPGTTYYVRAVAQNAAGTTPGAAASFSCPPSLPGVTTMAADGIGPTSATLHGTVHLRGLGVDAWFEWGTDPALAVSAQTEAVVLDSGVAEAAFSASLSGLAPGATYYFRAVAEDNTGRVAGDVESFRTVPFDGSAIMVNSAEDTADPPAGQVTLRSALEWIHSGGVITFAPHLDGATIALHTVANEHSVLPGEVFTMAGGRWTFEGFQERDYGRSALYVSKNVTIDASALPAGVAVRWAGGDADPARVLAVYGNLTMRNVTVTGGRAVASPIAGGSQPFTLGRGGGLAVWGVAKLDGCVIFDNRAEGDDVPSRDRGAFGGGIYANVVLLTDSVVSGNSTSGYGAAGGGIYSVGGTLRGGPASKLARSTVSGNRVTGQHAYGGGIYTDGGGPGNRQYLTLTNCTIARNLVEDHPAIAESTMSQFYYRGGGVYMSNGYLKVEGCTIAENRVTGNPYPFSGKPNMGGGGIAATIGNAHVVENMDLLHSIVVGNYVNEEADDVFTGSLIEFYSFGYNLVGKLDFRQMHVPIPSWDSLSRRHWPKAGDRDGVQIGEALDLDRVVTFPSVPSVGVDEGQAVVLWYPPGPAAADRIPAGGYPVDAVSAGYTVAPEGTDDFLYLLREWLRSRHADLLGADFGTSLEPWIDATFYETPQTWPSDPRNAPWISFWRGLETELDGKLGPAGLGDEFWRSFPDGPFGDHVFMNVYVRIATDVFPLAEDQTATPRPSGPGSDIGAIEAAQ